MKQLCAKCVENTAIWLAVQMSITSASVIDWLIWLLPTTLVYMYAEWNELESESMRQYADLPLTTTRQYAYCWFKLCGSMRIYQWWIYGSMRIEHWRILDIQRFSLYAWQRWINTVDQQEWANGVILRNGTEETVCLPQLKVEWQYWYTVYLLSYPF